MSLYDSLFYANDIEYLFSDKKCIGYLLQTEAALAEAQAANNIISQATAQIIKTCSNADFIDIDKLKRDIKLGGNAAIPLVQQLTKIVKSQSFEASKFVHLGATSQDIVDTASILQIRDFVEWLEKKIDNLLSELIKISQNHKDTIMVGRTLLQQAKPITFGLKTSGWLESIARSKARITEMKDHLFVVQLSGAVGSQNDNINQNVVASFAEILDLKPAFSWQSNRDNINEFASKLGILVGTLGKIARDISLLMQTEIGEVYEGAAVGKGGSSTMPHKRNPVVSAAIIANAIRMPQLVASMLNSMMQEHERSAGLWHAEWEVISEIMQLTAGCVEKSIDLVAGLEIDKSRMLENIEITNGLIFAEGASLALAKKIGKIQAHEQIEKACKLALLKHKHLKEVLQEMKVGIDNLDDLFLPENSIGNSVFIVESIIKKFK